MFNVRGSFAAEPILWLGGVVAALNLLYGAVSGDVVSLGEVWETLIVLGGALAGRSQVSPV